MFSGKTTHLLAAYREAVQHGHPSLLIKHSSDTRYHGKTEVVSHTNSREMAVSVHLLADPQLLPLILDKTHIFIDEGQFFPDLDVMADQFANMGKTVQIAALDGTFQRDAFPVVANIIPRVEKLTKLVAKCHTCQSDAPFSKRISQDTEVHVIGGQDKYQAACREHFFTNAI
jgi:thymidine kinase